VIPRSSRDDGGQDAPIVVQVFAQSDVGRTRDHNEDSFLVANLSRGEPVMFDRLVEQPADDAATLFMVADGMGGAAAGEVASATAVDVVLRHLREAIGGREKLAAADVVAAMTAAAEVANWSIFQQAVNRPELRGMGTTATIAVLLGDRLFVAQVGDSRAYLVRDGVATQLTKDQSLMQKLIEAGELTEEEAAQSERRNIILQALGPEPSVKVDLTEQPLRRDDVLVLCSDGLSGLIRPEQIAGVVNEELDLSVACDRLISMANDVGGPDNITVIAARFEGSGLQAARPNDEARYRSFTEGSGEPPATPEAVTQPWPSPETELDEDRRRLGMIYSRIIAGIGVGILLWVLWRFFLRG
jgi:protein phosphatase